MSTNPARLLELEKISAIVFDFDGVIANSMPMQERAWRQAIEHILGLNAGSILNQILYNLRSGRAGVKMFEGVAVSADKRTALRKEKDAIWDGIRYSVPLLADVNQFLPVFALRYLVAIATTAERGYVKCVLQRERLLEYFQHIITDRDVVTPKPAPDMLFELSKRLKLSINNMCMVGDTITDFEMCNAAGCEFILLSAEGGFFEVNGLRPAIIVKSWMELGKIFGLSGKWGPESVVRLD